MGFQTTFKDKFYHPGHAMTKFGAHGMMPNNLPAESGRSFTFKEVLEASGIGNIAA